MNVTFVKCESFGCKNLTSDLYKKLYGSYCFEHTSKVNKPVGFLDNPKTLSPISPRRTVGPGSPSRNSRIAGGTLENSSLSPEITFENYEYKPMKVSSPRRMPVSPPRKTPAYIPKTECCICKDLYEENKVMKCGHLICPECLEGRVREPYCDFCDEPLEGPFVTPEVLQKIEDKYKMDKEREIKKEPESEEESSESEEEEYEEENSESEEEEYEEENSESEEDSDQEEAIEDEDEQGIGF
jgi:hypothetical protein